MSDRTKTRLTGHALFACFLALLLSLTFASSATVAQSATPVASPVPHGNSIDAATAWLVGKQLDSGAFPGFSGTADVGTTTDATLALAAVEQTGADVHVALDKALAYLYASGGDYAAKGAGQTAKLVLAIEAAGGDPAKVSGGNPLTALTAAKPGDNALYGTGVFDHAYVILALASAGQPVPAAAIDALQPVQIADGSWGFDGKTTAGNGDTNTTALTIQALAAAGQGANPMVAKALAYLKSTQTSDGSFPYQPSTGAGDANSTALVVQAIIAAGQNPTSAEWHDAAGALSAFQNQDGAFRFQATPPDDNLFSTVQAIPALAGLDLGALTSHGNVATPIAA